MKSRLSIKLCQKKSPDWKKYDELRKYSSISYVWEKAKMPPRSLALTTGTIVSFCTEKAIEKYSCETYADEYKVQTHIRKNSL